MSTRRRPHRRYLVRRGVRDGYLVVDRRHPEHAEWHHSLYVATVIAGSLNYHHHRKHLGHGTRWDETDRRFKWHTAPGQEESDG